MTMMNTPALSMGLSVDNVTNYTQWVNSLPLLSQAEETRLAEDLQSTGNVESARQLVMSHLRFVVKVARQYAGYGLSEADLIQEGNIGLMKAVKRFDPKQGVRLVSFAIHWVKAEIHEFVIKNWRIVKIATTKAQRKLFFNLRKMKTQLTWFKEKEVQEVAENLNVKAETVRQMESRLYSPDASFDASPDDEENYAPADYLAMSGSNPEFVLLQQDTQENTQDRLNNAFTQLDERSQIILQKRFLSESKVTLHDLAEELNVSAERIRQLEKQALAKLKNLMA